MVASNRTRVGFIGLGIMGMSMARNILKAGYPLAVHNRSPEKVRMLVGEGATDGGSPAGVAACSDIIVMCLPDTPDVAQVLFSEQGVLSGAREGSVVIDTSTISPTSTREFAERLRTRGLELIDSPVSGGPAGARDGTLVCMMGGSEKAIGLALPVLQAIGSKHVHIGESGAGQLVKACNQMVIGATVAAVGEAVALCRAAGVDAARMRDALMGGSAQSKVLENHGKRILDGTFEPGFRSTLMLKDLRIAAAAAKDNGVFFSTGALAVELFTASCNAGNASLDSAALGALISELSGVSR